VGGGGGAVTFTRYRSAAKLTKKYFVWGFQAGGRRNVRSLGGKKEEALLVMLFWNWCTRRASKRKGEALGMGGRGLHESRKNHISHSNDQQLRAPKKGGGQRRNQTKGLSNVATAAKDFKRATGE